MRLLLDTHVFLWSISSIRQLPPQVREKMLSPANEVFVSVATAWEIGIKKGLGKLTAPDGLEREILRCGFSALPVTFTHTEAVAGLPRHHRDPFDRMLIVQARLDRLTLVTADPVMRQYDVDLLFID